MSLLDKASLIVTPNAYKESKLYSVVPSSGAGDMTVVRATTATRVNSAGLIEVVPKNLVTYSNAFSDGAWEKQSSSVNDNVIISPDGTQNASKFIATATNAFHAIWNGLNTYIGTYTFSVYAKKGEYNFLILQDQFSGTFACGFNLNTGAVAFGSNTTIENVGNGWYRCSVRFTASSVEVIPTITISPTTSAGYLGNGTSGGYIWHAQIEQGSTATEYFPTTTRLNIPRIDYTNGSCPSLLVEPQRTNLLTYSEQFNNAAWTANEITITANNTTSPDGTQSADRALETAANAYHDILNLNATLSAGTTYTLSCFVKYAGREFIYLFVSNGIAAAAVKFNIQTGVVLGTALGSVVSSKIENYGNGWYRCSVVYTSAILATATLAVSTTNSGALSLAPYTGDITKGIYVWGAQLEAGSYPTSYIPTVASTVTRNADVISKTGISSLIGQTEGTLFCEINLPNPLSSGGKTIVVIGTSPNRVYIAKDSSTQNILQLATQSASGYNFINTSAITTSKVKIAIAYKSGDNAFYVNGSLISSASATTNPTSFSKLLIGDETPESNTDIKINSVQLYKTRLTNTELAQLTTL